MAERAAKALMLTFEAALHCMDQGGRRQGWAAPRLQQGERQEGACGSRESA